MNINKAFKISRFINQFQNDILINYKRYLFTFAGFSILLYFVFLFDMRSMNYTFINNHVVPEFSNRHYLTIFMLCLAAIGLFIGMSFPELSNKIRARNYIQLPGSIFEKILVQFIIRFVISTLLLFVIFWIVANLARLTAIQFEYVQKQGIKIYHLNFSVMFSFLGTLKNRVGIFISIFSLGTFIFAARLFFTKSAVLKTIILGAILFFIFFCFLVICSHVFYPEITHGFAISIPDYKLSNNLSNTELYIYSIGVLSWIFFLPLAYYKLKEKQE
jgi:hypothetical protein